MELTEAHISASRDLSLYSIVVEDSVFAFNISTKTERRLTVWALLQSTRCFHMLDFGDLAIRHIDVPSLVT